MSEGLLVANKSKSKKLIKLRFTVQGRVATLEDVYYINEVKRLFSFMSAGARFHPAHKQWLKTLAEWKRDPEYAPAPSGWDGRISALKNGSIGVGLLKSFKPVLLKAGFRLKITKWKNRPSVDMRKGFVEKASKYEYQNECVTAMLESITSYGGGIVLSATGTGKTKIAAQFCSWLTGNVLFVVDEIHLLYQSQKEIQQWLKDKGYDTKVGVVGNSKFEPERVTVATRQTLAKHQNNLTFRVWRKEIDVVIIDELHVQMSRSNFNIIEDIKPQAVIGLTATLQMRKKDVALRAQNIAGPVVYTLPIKKGVELGVLTKGVVVQVSMPPNDEKRLWVKRKVTDKKTGKSKTKKVICDDYEHHVVYNNALGEAVSDLAKAALARKFAIAVLVDRIKHITRMNKLLTDKVVPPKLFYGKIKNNERQENISRFEKGKSNLILANRVFTKGVNVKRLDVIIDAAMRASKNNIQQKYGRGVRLFEGKTGLIFFSLVVKPKGLNEARPFIKIGAAHRSAFRAVKTPLLEIAWTTGTDVLKKAEKFLQQELQKGSKSK